MQRARDDVALIPVVDPVDIGFSISCERNAANVAAEFLHDALVAMKPALVALEEILNLFSMQLVGSEGSSSSSGGGGMWSWSSKALDSALAHPRPHDSSHLAIIVQTNFQLCAYTTSELHVSMLGLFCDVQTIRRLPNVVFMSITRDSIKAAFALGIQAQQILRFLEKHAHPKLRQGTTSPLPPNVIDQVFLWDRERHRLAWNEVFSHQCMMAGEFQAVRKYTMDLGAHSWSNEGRNQLYIKYEYAEVVQTFVRKWRAEAAARAD